jgi:tRNA modification GTPase
MFSTEDTIVAIATPAGRGGIGVVRISGPASVDIANALLDLERPLQPRYATFARTHADQVVATYFPAPHSYTGEHVIEISGHGSPVVMRQIVQEAMRLGSRLAEPGEFTLRAFLNGRIDLVQAEAVADLIDAVTPLQARAAFDQLEGTLTERIGAIDSELFELTAKLEASLDFPEEGYHFLEAGEAGAALRALEDKVAALLCDATRGRMIREGTRAAIGGKPNVGKSSLFNALLGSGRAIVTPVPGTTRDFVTETVDIEGLQVELIDTAGVRETTDAVEIEGVSRARRAWAVADLVIVVLDRGRPLDSDDLDLLRETAEMPRLIVANKADLPPAWVPTDVDETIVTVSSTSGCGLDSLRAAIRSAVQGPGEPAIRDTAAVTNVRHAELLVRARAALRRAGEAVEAPGGPIAEEFVLTDLQEAREALEEVTGKRTSEDLLRHIFARFCIGK